MPLSRRPTPPAASPPRLPDGERAYAIGDVHGRLDLLIDLLRRIAADDSARGAAGTQVILLGDLVDRGAHPAGVIEYLRAFAPGFARFRFVMGSHEQAMLAALDDETGDPHRSGWLAMGGAETLASYGVPPRLLALPGPALVAALHHYVPRRHLAFLRGFEGAVRIGDYRFVHAAGPGADPGPDPDPGRARAADDATVVHGHTVLAAPRFRAGRIGIDTGACDSGVLTALGLERDEQWIIATAPRRAIATRRGLAVGDSG